MPRRRFRPARPFRLAALALLLVAAAPAPARAGAWTPEPGSGLAIFTLRHLSADRSFDAAGDTVPGGYDKTELAAYAEWGLVEGLAGLVSATLIDTRVDGPPEDARRGLDRAAAGLRARLAEGEAGVVSVEGRLGAPGAEDPARPASQGATDWEADARLLLGRGWEIGGWSAYVDLQAGRRLRFGAPPDEWRLDATLGVRPLPPALLTAQLFGTVSVGAGEPPFTSRRSLDGALAAAWDLAPDWTLQAGVLGTLVGENTGREVGGFVALWRRF